MGRSKRKRPPSNTNVEPKPKTVRSDDDDEEVRSDDDDEKTTSNSDSRSDEIDDNKHSRNPLRASPKGDTNNKNEMKWFQSDEDKESESDDDAPLVKSRSKNDKMLEVSCPQI